MVGCVDRDWVTRPLVGSTWLQQLNPEVAGVKSTELFNFKLPCFKVTTVLERQELHLFVGHWVACSVSLLELNGNCQMITTDRLLEVGLDRVEFSLL